MPENPFNLLSVGKKINFYIEKDGSLVAGDTSNGPNHREAVVFNNGNPVVCFNDRLIWVDHLVINSRRAIRPHDPREYDDLKTYYRGIGILPDSEYSV